MKVLFVEYCAKDILDGTNQMEPLVELVYRRIIDMIYSTNDELLDSKALQYATKAGKKWAQIRDELITVHKKIYIENGYIRNAKCTEKLQKSRKNIEQKSVAGKASFETRKCMKEKESDLTAVQTLVPTDEPTNQEPKNPIKEKKKKYQKEKEFSECFLEFWEVYPRHRRGNREDAFRAWRKSLEEQRATEAEMLSGAKSYAKSEQGQGQYAKGAAAWLNADRWNWEIKAADFRHQKHLWPEWKHKLAREIGQSNVASWFSDTELNGTVLYVSKQFQAENIRTRFLSDIEKAFERPYQIVVKPMENDHERL